MDNKNEREPRVKIVHCGKDEGLAAAYKLLAKKIMEEKLHAVRNLRQGKH